MQTKEEEEAMPLITVSNDRRTLFKDGKPHFYLADTCWSAFTNIPDNEWINYLKKRKTQGFNALQINILPQWDRSVNDFQILPFPEKDGAFDFSQPINEAYFQRAQRLCEIAQQNDFTLSLVLLWSNYVSGTWASELDEKRNIFPQSLLENYFEHVIQYFDQFSPIYVIGGDTDFPAEETIKTYETAFEYFTMHSKNTLKTIHIRGRLSDIPEEIVEKMDLYFYQSGHNISFLDMPYRLAEKFYANYPAKPIINSEPCYEQMGYSRKVYGRFSQRDVRKAAWQSVLSGAFAGVTYGAHGIWSWHDSSSVYSGDAGEAFDQPMNWQEALYFPGANDYGYIKQFLELLDIHQILPFNHVLEKGDASIRVGYSAQTETYLVYLPSNTPLTLNVDLSNYQITLIDLKDNRFYKIEPEYVIHYSTGFPTHNAPEDVLLVARKNSDNPVRF
ncbi:apiosidase-like domain-containing protein [Lactovum odontotermitis]